MSIRVTDFFCGAGGSSTGLAELPDVEIVIAANHWQIALESHAMNHPNTDHRFGDLRITQPSEFEYTEMAWFSPECTNHTLAKGKARKNIGQRSFWGDDVDPDEERSRATMREVVEFTAYHKYEVIIVENVTEIRYWQFYDEWLKAMHDLGYEHKEVFLNSMHVGVPQSRDRIYVCFWKKGNRKPDLDIHPVGFCQKCGCDVGGLWVKKNPAKALPGRVMYGKQYAYICPKCTSVIEPYTVPAATVIDWDRKSIKIGDRVKPLSVNTMRRIQKGLDKYGDRKFVIAHYGSAVYTEINEPLSAIATKNKHMLVNPGAFIIDTLHGYEVSDNSHMRGIERPLPTLTTAQSLSLVQPMPFGVSFYGRDSAHFPMSAPFPAITGINNQKSMVVPDAFIAPYYGTDESAHVVEPMPTATTKARHGLVEMKPTINDCAYRMIHVEELKRGMSFPDEYIICGTSDEVKNKQIGNAVTCNVATELGARMIASIA